MKRWFEYLAGKGFIGTLTAWRSIMKSGHSIMVVCDDPGVFDPEFVPPSAPALPADFWVEFERSRIPVDRRFEQRDDRAAVAKIAHDLASELRMNAVQRVEPQPEVEPREWKSTVETGIPVPVLNAPIVPVSDELREKLGLPEAV
jgi:hypothetical protein